MATKIPDGAMPEDMKHLHPDAIAMLVKLVPVMKEAMEYLERGPKKTNLGCSAICLTLVDIFVHAQTDELHFLALKAAAQIKGVIPVQITRSVPHQ